MDNSPSEGEDKQNTQSRPYDLISIPQGPSSPDLPFSSDVSKDSSSTSTTQPQTGHASALILQWLTYAFWGWTALVLSALVIASFQRLVAGINTSTFNYYVIAALFVLLPVSFICDLFYSKTEPDKKTGPSSLVMVVHAVIFALFTIGSLLFAAWSIVSAITNSNDHSIKIADLCAALILTEIYGATFIRTLNPSHIRWIPKVYRYMMIGLVMLFVLIGFIKPSFVSTPKFEPSIVGGTQCDLNNLNDGSTYAQVALYGGADCTTAESVIQDVSGKNGKGYSSNGYDCKAIKQGSHTKWSSYWNNNFYSYSCSNGSKGVAFNWQSASQSGYTNPSPQTDPSPTPSNNFGTNGSLEPTDVGGAQCNVSSNYAQVAIAGAATCTTAEAIIQAVPGDGSNYTSNGYSCKSAKQGAGTKWSSYWNDNFYSYTCSKGSDQVAFNWQSAAQSNIPAPITN